MLTKAELVPLVGILCVVLGLLVGYCYVNRHWFTAAVITEIVMITIILSNVIMFGAVR